MQPSVTNQPVQGGTGGLAQMFRNNAATAGAPAQLPQIMAPQRPNIGMPPQMPRPQMQAPQQGATLAFADMSPQQRLGAMMGGKFNPQSGRMDLPDNLDRDSAIAARNAAKGTMRAGGENPFSNINYNFRGGSGRGS